MRHSASCWQWYVVSASRSWSFGGASRKLALRVQLTPADAAAGWQPWQPAEPRGEKCPQSTVMARATRDIIYFVNTRTKGVLRPAAHPRVIESHALAATPGHATPQLQRHHHWPLLAVLRGADMLEQQSPHRDFPFSSLET